MAPMHQTSKSIDLTDKTKLVPITKLSKDSGINLHWSKDSKTPHWTLGNQYYSANASENRKNCRVWN